MPDEERSVTPEQPYALQEPVEQEGDVTEDLSQDFTPLASVPSYSPLPPVPTESEMREMEEEQTQEAMDMEQKTADRVAEQQERAQEAAERYADKRAQESDADDLFGVDEEDVMGGPADEIEDDFSVDPADFEIDNEDIMGGDAQDFSDILEVKPEDVMGEPPASATKKSRRTRSYNPPVNPQLGGMTF